MIPAGAMDRRIALERATLTDDGFGQVETWAPLAEVWAEARPVSDRERLAAAEVGAEITHRFRVRRSRALADLNPRDRLIFEGRAYNISAAKEIGRRAGIEITASARSDQG